MDEIVSRKIFVGFHENDTSHFERLSSYLLSHSIEAVSFVSFIKPFDAGSALYESSYTLQEQVKQFETNLHNTSIDVFVFILTPEYVEDHFLLEQIEKVKQLKKRAIGFVATRFYKDKYSGTLPIIDATADYDSAIEQLSAIINEDRIVKLDEETPKAVFMLGKMTFCVGDLFDDNLISQSNVLIIPISAQGTVNENIKVNLQRFGQYRIRKDNLGTLTFVNAQKINGPITIGYAYSVDAGQSNYEAIDSICSLVKRYLSEHPDSRLMMPLLGTGTGKLEPDRVADIYLKHFRNATNAGSITICINKPLVFDHLQEVFDNPKKAKTSNPDIKSRLHSDTFTITEADVLHYDIIAENIFSILTADETNPPLNIAVMAPWGRGKTSLMRRLKDKFDKQREKILSQIYSDLKLEIPKLKIVRKWLTKPFSVCYNIPFATVWFNPWNYQSSDMIWAGLADAVITQVVEQIPSKTDREIFWFQLRLARMDKDEIRKDIQTRLVLSVCTYSLWAITAVLFFILWILHLDSLPMQLLCTTVSISGIFTTIASLIKPYSKKFSEAFDRYTKSPKYTEKTGTFHEVQTDLNRVLDLCVDAKKPLVIFIDDLDRCSPAKVVEVVEAINVFINGQYNYKCYFIIGMDAEMVAAALDVAYEKMKGRIGSKEQEQGSVGWYFLDKFIQLPFFIPVISETKKREYLESLLSEKDNFSIPGDGVVNKEKVNKVFAEVMRTNDVNESSKAIRNAFLTQEEKLTLQKKILDNQVNLQKHNDEINKQVSSYSSFISSDPRSLKRFANLLRFYSSYQFLRMKQGESYVEINVLAKWLSIMLKFPQLIRWIQWDSDNRSGMNDVAEEKAKILDGLIGDYIGMAPEDIRSHNHWLNSDCTIFGEGKKIKDMQEMPWLQSQKLFEILTKKFSEESRLVNALSCNVW